MLIISFANSCQNKEVLEARSKCDQVQDPSTQISLYFDLGRCKDRPGRQAETESATSSQGCGDYEEEQEGQEELE